MKAISSSIVVAAGVYAMTQSMPLLAMRAGGVLPSLFAFAASLVVIGLGLTGWWASLKYDR
ncbi:hypothetical protein [Luteolibacter sp. LG18]|uniref:hypothetical protein n=1 Tax=Luteolibacter sp. LG18 TaxID=2819286 RepID=UPI002B2BEB68|nr:hypothetical protein llg_45220 [Luteolibacter sp. LG18]